MSPTSEEESVRSPSVAVLATVVKEETGLMLMRPSLAINILCTP